MKKPHIAALVVVALVASVTFITATSDDDEVPIDRQAEIADRSRAVMPFDLEATTHQFIKAETGLRQVVVADDPSDASQIELVRSHLRGEAARFRRGDFGDPAAIHGGEMPGLAELRAHGGRLSIGYRDTAAGAQLTFSSSDAGIVDALHRWADAQVADHGAHAETG